MKKTCLHLSIALGIAFLCGSTKAFANELEFDDDLEALLDNSIFELQAPVPVQDLCFSTETIIELLTPPSPCNILDLLR